MTDLIALFLAGQREFGALVDEVGDRWDDPTPDSEWTVASLVDHLIDEQRWLAPLLGGMSLTDAEAVVKAMRPADVDRVASWFTAAAAAAEAVVADGVLDRTVELSRGPTPAAGYVTEM